MEGKHFKSNLLSDTSLSCLALILSTFICKYCWQEIGTSLKSKNECAGHMEAKGFYSTYQSWNVTPQAVTNSKTRWGEASPSPFVFL